MLRRVARRILCQLLGLVGGIGPLVLGVLADGVAHLKHFTISLPSRSFGEQLIFSCLADGMGLFIGSCLGFVSNKSGVWCGIELLDELS